VTISPQTSDYALSDVKRKELTFPVLRDTHYGVARLYGPVSALSDVTENGSATDPEVQPRRLVGLPMPGTFVLNRTGTVRVARGP
jgi:peroxiredoxin